MIKPLNPANIRVDHTNLDHPEISMDVLRLDLVHPVISGNKWFKLKEYIKDAGAGGKKAILTFGGAYSNHIVATSAAASLHGLKSIGIIRGEKPAQLSHTLKEAMEYGMDLHFISREEYRNKTVPADCFSSYKEDEVYTINEGGYGIIGARGATDILSANTIAYTHILAAVGTGTTLAGLVMASDPGQKITGISVMKNNFSLQQEIGELLDAGKKNAFNLVHDYHFGGYAKYTQDLIDFMNHWYRHSGIPSDFVYTGKLFYAVNDLIKNKYFPPGSKILVVHSGGLQGNLSLSNGKLIF